jgi:hypothetical protein
MSPTSSTTVTLPAGARDRYGSADGASPRRVAPGHKPAPPRVDDWPHTKRILPWLIAGFILMLWLVPFDTISMTVSLPFELKLDRIVLPVVVAFWCLALAVGGPGRPRLRLTPIHIAVGTYTAVAFLSVILNVGWLNRELLFSTSLKQLVLLSSYVAFFLIVASSIRPTEVRAFVKFSLLLALVCAVGTLYELHDHENLFYRWAATLLPSGLFSVPQPDPTAVDELGRQLTIGPSEAPLELATMVALALPLAFVGLMRSARRRDKVLYALASALLLAAGLATYRKSSLVLPAVVVVLLVAFRPRQSVRLLPLAAVLFVLVHALAPGVIGSVVAELSPGKVTAVGTTAHRTSGYEAIRPIVWSRPATGEGYGSYNANAKRILDSEILMSAIDTGVVGLLCFLAMMVTTLLTARKIFGRVLSERAWLAIGLGLGAAVFFVASFLYDTMEFPHGPYIFLTFAGLVAVLYTERQVDSG